LCLAGTTEHVIMEVNEQNRVQFTHKWKAVVSHGILMIWMNFANWPTEFGKIFHGKLRALHISVQRQLLLILEDTKRKKMALDTQRRETAAAAAAQQDAATAAESAATQSGKVQTPLHRLCDFVTDSNHESWRQNPQTLSVMAHYSEGSP